MINKKTTALVFCVWLHVTLFIATNTFAQNLVIANPANYRDAKALFINPAVLPYQPSQVLFGMKIFHVGFIQNDAMEFRNNYFGITSPYLLNRPLVVGFMGQYFSLPVYRQSQFSVNVSHRLSRWAAIGAKYNIFSYIYDKSNFDVIDQYDPVFANGTVKTAHSFGVGFIFFPRHNLDIGISWDHINRPDVSLANAGIKQPHLIDVGVRYTYKSISAIMKMNVFENNTSFSWMLESFFPGKGSVRIGYGTKSAIVEGQLKLIKGFSLLYGYDYPLYDFNDISSGSHQISCVYDFAYNRFYVKKGATSTISNALISTDLVVDLSTDRLQIMKKMISRSYGNGLSDRQLDALTEHEIGIIDSSQHDENFKTPEYRPTIGSGNHTKNKKLSDTYKKQLLRLASSQNSEENSRIYILTNPITAVRSQEIKDELSRHFIGEVTVRSMQDDSNPRLMKHEIKNSDSFELLFPRKAEFQIRGEKLNYIHNWQLEICDFRGHVIKRFRGTDEITPLIEWDWRDTAGNFPEPDEYYYSLSWRDPYGNLLATPRKSFKVEKIIRHLNVEVLAEPKKGESDQGVLYEIKLHK